MAQPSTSEFSSPPAPLHYSPLDPQQKEHLESLVNICSRRLQHFGAGPVPRTSWPALPRAASSPPCTLGWSVFTLEGGRRKYGLFVYGRAFEWLYGLGGLQGFEAWLEHDLRSVRAGKKLHCTLGTTETAVSARLWGKCASPGPRARTRPNPPYPEPQEPHSDHFVGLLLWNTLNPGLMSLKEEEEEGGDFAQRRTTYWALLKLSCWLRVV